jgi:protein-S-isoprenylcysteine O-methyltransferase Ste14
MPTNQIFRIAFFVVLVVMLIMRIFFNARVSRSGERIMPDRQAIMREGIILFASRVVLFFLLIAVLIMYAFPRSWLSTLDFYLPAWLHWLGVIIGVLSIALTAWTELELGRQYSAQLQLRDEHKLITTGPYTHIRHPHYTAITAFGLSLALISANWFFVAFFLVSALGLWYRVPKEEQMMIAQFGEEYRAYIKRTGRFLPKIAG